mmetsp:Transcript_5680/g.12320  ORF Transcript_5680/g.12320 Transcript_5680/m.12320 type:complete len:891 (+) Transcript_5680:223-2895(+)
MAGGGMGVVALHNCLDKESRSPHARPDAALNFSVHPESVEITALSEEKTIEQSEILTERHIASRPLKAYQKVCKQWGEDESGAKPDRLRRKKEEFTNPLIKILYGIMPILTWIRALDWRTVRADVVAGLTVGVMVIPQSMSYGAIAGLPYINGMYSACIPTLIYAFFGQSRQLAVGPVAMVSLLVEAGLRGQLTEAECPEWYAMGGEGSGKAQYEVCEQEYVYLACLTAAVVGGMQIISSILKLGFLVSFLGHPVTSGFTSGAAIIIGLSQTKYMLGYDVPKSQYIYDTIYNIVKGLGEFNGMTFFLGAAFLCYLIVNKKLAQRYRPLRMLGPVGPLVCCLVGSLLVLCIPPLVDNFHVKYVGHIPHGLMPLSLGAFQVSNIGRVLPTALSACLIGYMESIAIGKNLASKHGYEIDAGQEMLALGFANLIGAAFSCYPVTGSFSRSAVNNSTGALTQLSGMITAIVMFATLMFLTPLFYYLPKFVLAAIVLNSVIPLVALSEARRLWRVKRNDCFLWVVAFLGTLFFGVLPGILVAVSLSLAIVIYESVRPQITILWRIPGTNIYRNMKQENNGSFIPNIFICRIGSSLYFANAQYVKDLLMDYVTDVEEVNPTQYLVLEMTPVVSIDSSACHVIHDIVSDFRSRGIEVAFAMVGNRVDKTMRKAKLKKMIGDQWFFHTVHEAVSYCLRHQHAKASQGSGALTGDHMDLTGINVGFQSEIGFSNDLHPEDTMVFITLAHDVPMIMSEITAVFKRSQLTVIRAQIEPLNHDGAKHTYFVRSLKSGSKLSEKELDRVREELEALLARQNAREPRWSSISGSRNDSGPFATGSHSPDRIGELERKIQVMQDILLAKEGITLEEGRIEPASPNGGNKSFFGKFAGRLCCHPVPM